MKSNLEQFTDALEAKGLTHHLDDGKIYITNPKNDTLSNHPLQKLSELYGTLTFMHTLSPGEAINEIVDLIIESCHTTNTIFDSLNKEK